MSGESLDYWRNKFDLHLKVWIHEEPMKTAPDWYEYITVFKLLCEYASVEKSGLWGLTGGTFWSRFWSGRWGTNHGNEIHEALQESDALPLEEQSVANLISIVKTKLTNKILNPEGDLSRILKVVEEKTSISNTLTLSC